MRSISKGRASYFKPTTPSNRSLVLPSFSQLGSKSSSPLKASTSFKSSRAGRNNNGRITCRHRGGGHRRKYRVIDFKRDKDGIQAKVVSIEYDPNRSSHIALLSYEDGEKRYIIAPEGIKAGDRVKSGDEAPFNKGCSMQLKSMPIGSVVHNVELYPGRGGKFVRSAGLSVRLMARRDGYVTLKMPSNEVRMVRDTCRATFGVVSNSEHALRVDGKAGRRRWQGFRPTVRGTAMNPVDHPHGGGEGRQNSYIPRSPWGTQAKGYKTRPKSRFNKLIIRDRRKK